MTWYQFFYNYCLKCFIGLAITWGISELTALANFGITVFFKCFLVLPMTEAENYYFVVEVLQYTLVKIWTLTFRMWSKTLPF
jgi:hypothetical protein